MTLVHLWHAACWAALQTLPPQRAARLAGLAGGCLRPWSASEAVRYSHGLRGGTCLSRSLAIATRMANARVAIGAQPHASRARFAAHAWVEIDGVPLIASEATGSAIATLNVSRAGNDSVVHVCFDKGDIRCEI